MYCEYYSVTDLPMCVSRERLMYVLIDSKRSKHVVVSGLLVKGNF